MFDVVWGGLSGFALAGNGFDTDRVSTIWAACRYAGPVPTPSREPRQLVAVPLARGGRTVGAGVRDALERVELSGSAALLAPLVARLADAVDAAAKVDVDLMLAASREYVALVDRLGLDLGGLPATEDAPAEQSAADRVRLAGEAGPR